MYREPLFFENSQVRIQKHIAKHAMVIDKIANI